MDGKSRGMASQARNDRPPNRRPRIPVAGQRVVQVSRLERPPPESEARGKKPEDSRRRRGSSWAHERYVWQRLGRILQIVHHRRKNGRPGRAVRRKRIDHECVRCEPPGCSALPRSPEAARTRYDNYPSPGNAGTVTLTQAAGSPAISTLVAIPSTLSQKSTRSLNRLPAAADEWPVMPENE